MSVVWSGLRIVALLVLHWAPKFAADSPLARMDEGMSGGGIIGAVRPRHRSCFQCHMPYECSTGFCYGDYCVKSMMANRYVSKGCENRTSSGLSRHSSYVALTEPSGCFETEIFGMSNVICYCSDTNYCNGVSPARTISRVGLGILLFLIVLCLTRHSFLS